MNPTQLEILTSLNRGNVVTRYSGDWYRGWNRSYRAITTGTCETLRVNGLIGLHERGGGREAFVITEAGRAAMRKAEASHV